MLIVLPHCMFHLLPPLGLSILLFIFAIVFLFLFILLHLPYSFTCSESSLIFSLCRSYPCVFFSAILLPMLLFSLILSFFSRAVANISHFPHFLFSFLPIFFTAAGLPIMAFASQLRRGRTKRSILRREMSCRGRSLWLLWSLRASFVTDSVICRRLSERQDDFPSL